MLKNNRCFVCNMTGHIGNHCPDAQCYHCDVMATSPRTVQRKFPHEEHHATMTGHAPNQVMTTIIGTDPSPSLDTTKEDVLTNQDHANDLTMAEAPAAIGGMHPTLLPTTTSANDTHPPKDALGDTLARTQNTGTTTSHLWPTSFQTGVTLMTILQTKAGLVWNSLITLPTIHTCRRHWSYTHGKQPLIDLNIRRSPFMTHSQTLPWNHMTLIL